MNFLQLVSGLFDKAGFRVGCYILIGAGATEVLPFLGVNEHIAHGAVWIGGGVAGLLFGNKYFQSEAEKRVENPNLGSSSKVPEIQTQIQKINDAKP